jgi:putative ATPase
MQTDLFHTKKTDLTLASEQRPTKIEDFYGQKDVITELLRFKEQKPHLIFWGPPGTGKTTLAHILSHQWHAKMFKFNAVLGGIPELKKLLEEIKYVEGHKILFIDEIHRFNKSQQDALLPYLEEKNFQFIGATTEYPQTALNRALLSRVRLLELKSLKPEEMKHILEKALQNLNRPNLQMYIKKIAELSDGDARSALNALSLLLEANESEKNDPDFLPNLFSHNRRFDRQGDRHYNVISAFIKSIRGSDPDAALLWLAVMLDGGEEPEFIARRLMILASEDIGLANSQALQVATNAHYVVKNIGMPEARITLSHATIFLSLSPKSNSAYEAIDKALEYVKEQTTLEVPLHLTAQGKHLYKYPHQYENHFIDQQYQAKENKIFFRPGKLGSEKTMVDNWNQSTKLKT